MLWQNFKPRQKSHTFTVTQTFAVKWGNAGVNDTRTACCDWHVTAWADTQQHCHTWLLQQYDVVWHHVARDRTYSGCISMVIHSTLGPRLRVTDMQGRHIPIQKYLMRPDGVVSLHNISACFASKHNLTYTQKCVVFEALHVSRILSRHFCHPMSVNIPVALHIFIRVPSILYSPNTNTVAKKTIFYCEYAYI
jgi:hypothetical protein